MTDLIASTKSNLKRIVPNAKDILVKIERDHEVFLSKIHVQVPGKVLHAEKKAENVWEALESSYQAVLRQIQKIKTKRLSKRKYKKHELAELLDSAP